jgi:hypothetical protein
MAEPVKVEAEVIPPLNVKVRREPFSDYFELFLDDGTSEEHTAEDTHRWFEDRGANMYAVGKMLDHVWNFGSADVTIAKPVRPKIRQHPTAPEL